MPQDQGAAEEGEVMPKTPDGAVLQCGETGLKTEIEQAEAEIAEIRKENPNLLPECYRPRNKERKSC